MDERTDMLFKVAPDKVLLFKEQCLHKGKDYNRVIDAFMEFYVREPERVERKLSIKH